MPLVSGLASGAWKNQNVRRRRAVGIPMHIKIRTALVVGDHLRVLYPVLCAQCLVLLGFLFPNPLVIGERLFLNLLLIPSVSFLYQIILNCFFFIFETKNLSLLAAAARRA